MPLNGPPEDPGITAPETSAPGIGSLGISALGKRVVVRYLDPVATAESVTGRPQFRDVLGELVGLGEDRLVVRLDNGRETGIALTQIVAAKSVPARTTREGNRHSPNPDSGHQISPSPHHPRGKPA
jgi:hypothetical protein